MTDVRGTAVVTGAADGMGLAIAEDLAGRGAGWPPSTRRRGGGTAQ
ncbi:hypothetical protein [Nonomuraea zeae]|nr:hypothetical protein [Nonomuraea zeae]